MNFVVHWRLDLRDSNSNFVRVSGDFAETILNFVIHCTFDSEARCCRRRLRSFRLNRCCETRVSNRVDEALLSVREEPDPIRWTFTRKTHTCKYTYNVYTHLQITEGGYGHIYGGYTCVTHETTGRRRKSRVARVFSAPGMC